MKSKFAMCGVLVLILAILALGVSALPVVIDEVEIDDTPLSPGTNQLEFERGEEVKVEVWARALADVDDVEISASIKGYEYNDYESISDSTHVFDMEAGVVYHETLWLKLPDRIDVSQDTDPGDYKVRIMIADRYDDVLIESYNLEVDAARHALKIRDVIFSPEQSVVAGRSLLSSVLVKNIGDRDEDSVRVKISIPDLGLSATDYIDEIEPDDSVLSEELWMRIPDCAEEGLYQVLVDVEYDEGYEEVSASASIYVTESDTCDFGGDDDDDEDDEEEPSKDKTVITISTQSQDLVSGEGGAVYAIGLTNEGTSSRTYVVSVDGLADWATYRISPSNVVVVDAGESQSVYVYVAANADTQAGTQMFSISVSTADKVLKSLPMTARVVAAEEPSLISWDRVRRALEIGFFVLIVVLVVLAIIVGFSLLRRKEEPDEISGQTYY